MRVNKNLDQFYQLKCEIYVRKNWIVEKTLLKKY